MWQEFLRHRAFPLFKGCAEFFLTWLVEDDKGHLVTNPSTSPEHDFIAPDGQTASVSYGTTMDMAILHNFFSAMIAAAKVNILISFRHCHLSTSISIRTYYRELVKSVATQA